jgi:hypothetical protein
MKSKLVVAIALTLGTLSSAALAEAPAKAQRAPKGPVMLEDTIIKLKPPRPLAAVDVSRLAPKLTLAELQQPLIGRIEEAIEKEPF